MKTESSSQDCLKIKSLLNFEFVQIEFSCLAKEKEAQSKDLTKQ